MDYYNSDYLAHYGVKGMRWGVRRYRNEDGSLTEAGKKRQAAIGITLMKRSNAYQYKANRAIQKQQKLQGKRLDEWRKSNGTKGVNMSKKEKRLFDKYATNTELANKMYKIGSTAIKDLSKEDISRGQRYMLNSLLIGQFLAGPIGSGIASGINESRADRYIKEYEQTH